MDHSYSYDDYEPEDLAAAGVLEAAGYYGECEPIESPGDFLRRLFAGSPYPIPWRPPPAKSREPLAAAWKAARPGRARLELQGVHPEGVPRLLERLRKARAGAYVRSDRPDLPVRWRWPLRVGIPGGFEEMRDAVRSVHAAVEWMQHLVRLVEEGPWDLLLLPLPLDEAVKRQDLPVEGADCVIVTEGFDPSGTTVSQLDELRKRLQSAGAATVPVTDMARWFLGLIEQISHNRGIDEALDLVSPAPPILLADRRLAVHSHVSRRVARLKTRYGLRKFADREITIGAYGRSRLGLPDKARLKDVAATLRSIPPREGFDHERGMSSVAAELEAGTAETTHAQRFLLARVAEDRDGAFVPRPNAFRRGGRHVVTVKIGVTREGWEAPGRAFPEDELPWRADEPLELTVLFKPLSFAAEPQLGWISLPPRGDSTECEFGVDVPANATQFACRIAVAYKNRILQTAVIRGAAVEDPRTAEGKLQPTLEALVYPDFAELLDRPAFDAVLVLNHDDDHRPGVTMLAEKHASFKSSADLIKETRWFDAKLGEIAYDKEAYESLDSEKTLKLLIDLARHGAQLYEHLVGDRIADKSLVEGDAIQIVATDADARLPAEFIYARKAPRRSATLCPHARRILTGEREPGPCDQTGDERDFICPMAFWGLSKILERHAHDPSFAEELAGDDFAFQAEPGRDRNELQLHDRALLGTSHVVELGVQGGIARIESALRGAVAGAPVSSIQAWGDWCDAVAAVKPSLLFLMVHTELVPQDNWQRMELGTASWLEVTDLDEEHVGNNGKQPPLVVLMGCETGAPTVSLHGFVGKLRRKGAAAVISSIATIHARHAVPVAEELLSELGAIQDGRSLGQVMRDVRRSMLGHGLPMALALTAHGDADWVLRR